jgi:hypothetical protein
VQVLATKGAGTIGGSNTQVQFNNAGALSGSANLTFDGTTLTSSGFSGPLNGTVGATTANTGAFTTLSASSTVSGTGFSTYLASPPAIGGTAAAAGKFTTLSASAIGSTIELKQNATGSATYYVMDNTIETGGKRWRFGYTGGAGIPCFSLFNQTDNLVSWVADASGNFGLGITPSTWSSGKAIEIGFVGNGVFGLANNNFLITQNAYYNSGFKYASGSSLPSSYYQQTNGTHAWGIAGSGTAGNAITYTTAMTLDNSSNFSITQTPGKYTVDTTGGVTAVANGGTVDFANASGMLIVNNWATGAVAIWLCGAGSVTLVSNISTTYGGFAYNAGIIGYRWTNNTGSTANFGFFFIRTRTNA